MYKGLKVGAVIVAAGKSRRMRGQNKQFLLIDGIPVIIHTLLKFQSSDIIDNIVLVTGIEEINSFGELIDKYGIRKVDCITAGGSERQQSVKNGLEKLKNKCGIAAIHDGARPFITPEIIEESVKLSYDFGAAACAVPVKDTIKVVDKEGFIEDTPDRKRLYAVQTPQVFLFDLIYSAHEKAEKEGYIGTDDASLVERTGTRVKLFSGSYQNIKITTPEDVYIGEAILKCGIS